MDPITNTLRSVSRQWAGMLALFLVLGTGSAVALSGKNTVSSQDLVKGAVKQSDIGKGAVTGRSVAGDTLTGADVDESTLAIAKGARAYAYVPINTCNAQTDVCQPAKAVGITEVTRDNTGIYCVIAPGIDGKETPAVVSVDFSRTSSPEGNASALTIEDTSCGDGNQQGFPVLTTRQPEFNVSTQSGTRPVSGSAERADDVSFSIVIP